MVGEAQREVTGAGQGGETRQVQLQSVLALAVVIDLEVVPSRGT
jgi:hypothetical protein